MYVKDYENSDSEKLLEDVIREMGLDHDYFTRTQNSNFYRSVGRYICYRYSGGIAGQKGIKEQVMRELDRIRNSLKKSLKLRKNEKDDIISLISKLKEKEFTKILPKLESFDDFEQLKSSLRSMSLNEVTTSIWKVKQSLKLQIYFVPRSR